MRFSSSPRSGRPLHAIPSLGHSLVMKNMDSIFLACLLLGSSAGHWRFPSQDILEKVLVGATLLTAVLPAASVLTPTLVMVFWGLCLLALLCCAHRALLLFLASLCPSPESGGCTAHDVSELDSELLREGNRNRSVCLKLRGLKC